MRSSVSVVTRLVGERHDERVRIAAVDDLAVGGRRRADEAVLHRPDRRERADPLDEAGRGVTREVVAQPEVDGMNEHASSGVRVRKGGRGADVIAT